MKIPETTFNYRGVKYEYIEWRTYNDQLASGYRCSDESLLKHSPTTSFGSRNKKEMLASIDYFLDNVEEQIEKQKLTDKAVLSTGYQLD